MIISDLHLHSKYSRAVSQKMDLEGIAYWAKLKGINLVGTADWTHPLWFRQIKEKLKEIFPGVFQLKNYPEVSFVLSTEISSIYSHKEKVRRIHNLIFSPSFETAEKIIKKLSNLGCNLFSDGRPIIGLSSKELLELILEIDKNSFLIPCHIWTPWFSLYGSKSGYNSIKEAFEELSDYIYAVETGLSSDPIMNWQIKELENRSIVSFSDAHSGQKLGREATVFIFSDNSYKAYSYYDIIDALKQKPDSKLKIGYTIEFFPEEGKYHWSGHRICNIRYTPEEVLKKGIICPVCQKPLTIGVENRVFDLSEKIIKKEELSFIKNKSELTFVYDKEKKRRPFVSIVPLLEVLLEITQSPAKAEKEFLRLIKNLGTEFEILLKKSYDEIEKIGGEKLKQAVEIIRERKVFVDPGYDGVFGKVKIFNHQNEEKKPQETQKSLF
ncbi:MAG: endonuclease Q family protein [Patescibacteria group bacterium]|nr:endonuclease Q family protein [Patescibacteria group bacterium]